MEKLEEIYEKKLKRTVLEGIIVIILFLSYSLFVILTTGTIQTEINFLPEEKVFQVTGSELNELVTKVTEISYSTGLIFGLWFGSFIARLFIYASLLDRLRENKENLE